MNLQNTALSSLTVSYSYGHREEVHHYTSVDSVEKKFPGWKKLITATQITVKSFFLYFLEYFFSFLNYVIGLVLKYAGNQLSYF